MVSFHPALLRAAVDATAVAAVCLADPAAASPAHVRCGRGGPSPRGPRHRRPARGLPHRRRLCRRPRLIRARQAPQTLRAGGRPPRGTCTTRPPPASRAPTGCRRRYLPWVCGVCLSGNRTTQPSPWYILY